MNIKTKYDIGDKVFIVIWNGKWIACNAREVCRYVIVATECGVNTAYFFKGHEHRNGVNEEYVFPTKKQAQAECNRRNKEEK